MRRDIPQFVSQCGKDVYAALFASREDGRFLLNVSIARAVVERTLDAVVSDSLPLAAYVKSASIGTDYVDEPLQVRLANKMRERGDDDAPSAGQRIDFVILELQPSVAAGMTKAEQAKVASRAEHPAFVAAHNAREQLPARRLRVDRAYYINALEPSIAKIFDALDADWRKRTFAAARARVEAECAARVTARVGGRHPPASAFSDSQDRVDLPPQPPPLRPSSSVSLKSLLSKRAVVQHV